LYLRPNSQLVQGKRIAMATDGSEQDMAKRPVSVFLSYSRDDRPVAEKIIAALQSDGFDVWWDGLLDGGVAFAGKTEEALERADAVVVLWSHRSTQSHWVKDEATRGRDRGCLVPASIDGTEAPLGFRQYQVLNFSKWKGHPDSIEIADLRRAITLVSGRLAGQPDRPALKHHPLPLTRRTLIVSGTAGGVLLTGSILAWRSGLWRSNGTGNSVAVLPFRNLSGDPAQDYFSDGLSEEVRSTLSRNPLLQVAAPTSAGQFRSHLDDAASVAVKLGVAYLLDGSVRRAGRAIRISAQLMDGKTGFSKWAQSFDRNLEDIFAVQSEIASTVADALAAQMSLSGTDTGGPSSNRANLGGTKNVAAYDFYLKGRAAYDRIGGEETDREALDWFEKAITADSRYGQAHAARSRTLASIASGTTDAGALRALYEASIVSAEKALTLAPALPDAYSAMGYAITHGRQDMRAAKGPFERSRALGWGDADVLMRYAGYSSDVGSTANAASAIRRAALLDPLNPRVYRIFGMIELAAKQYAESIASNSRALSMNPKMSGAYAAIGLAHYLLGDQQAARKAYDQESFSLFRLAGLSIIDRKSGNAAAADQSTAAMIAEYGDNALYQKAQILAQRGDTEAALDALERGHEVGDAGLLSIRHDPLLDPLRLHPRFARLMTAIGLDQRSSG
jgi:TolB-like protein/tetratricopeptide (TPR) repeat protein